MRAKYEPIGDELTIEVAAVQSALALDACATIAEQQRDHAGLLRAGEAWMKLADFLAALRDAEDKRPEKKQEKVPMGFQPPTGEESPQTEETGEVVIGDGELQIIEVENEEEDVRDNEDGTDASASRPGLHREHGKLRIPPR